MSASANTSSVSNILITVAGILVIGMYAYRLAWRRRFLRQAMRTPSAKLADPGWKPALALTSRIVPAKLPTSDPLTGMRSIFIGLVIALPLWILALSFITTSNRGSARAAPDAVVAVGAAALVGILLMRRRPLSLANEAALAGAFRAAMFIQIGLSEIPAMLGVAAAIVMRDLWVCVVGSVFGLIGLALTAPGPREVARRQRQIDAANSTLDLTRALMTPSRRPR